MFEEAYESVCMAPSRMASEALKPGLKPLPRCRLKAGLRQGVVGAPVLGSKAVDEVGVPASGSVDLSELHIIWNSGNQERGYFSCLPEFQIQKIRVAVELFNRPCRRSPH